jgi:hypothetical protein
MPKPLMLPKLRAQASFVPETLDAEKRTVEVLFYSGAEVQRFPFFDDPYMLSFSLDAKSVRLERFNRGAPLVDNHKDDRPVMDSVLGVVEKAWMAADGGHALVKIAADRQDILTRIQDGILRNFSMGAVIHQAKDITQKGDSQRRLLAIDWEPHELSLTPVPADMGAQALAQAEKFPCRLTLGAASAHTEATMKIKVRLLADVEDVGKLGEIVEIAEDSFDEDLHSKELNPKPAQLAADDRSEDRLLSDDIDSEKRRKERIRAIQMEYDRDDFWAERCIRKNFSVKEALADARKKRAEETPELDGRIRHGEDYDSLGWSQARMAEALHARAKGKACPDPAQKYARFSFAECGFEILQKLGKTRGRALDPLRGAEEVVKLALSTSDFAGLLANTLNKDLLSDYQIATQTFRTFAQQRNFKDYRPHTFHRRGDFPLPLQVGENGEIQQGAMGESKETVSALRYGRILPLSLEIIVNDDLNAFTDFGSMVSRRIQDLESALFYSRCIAVGSGLGPTLADGVVLYNATHANVNSAGALDNTRLEEAWGLMAAQTTIDSMKMNVPPRYVLTSATSHVLARRLLSPIFAAQASNVNAFEGILTAIYDANLSGTRYYVLADPSFGTNYIYGTINGQGPRFAVREGWEVEGVEVKVAHDFGCGAIDYRFGVTGAGA